MKNYQKLYNININDLIVTPCNSDKDKIYKYIKIDTLNNDTKNKIIKNLNDKKIIPNNFLNFAYEFYLDKLTVIYNSELKDDNSKSETGYIESFDSIEDYKNNKFGLVMKVCDNKGENQLILFCIKNQELLEQFCLKETLKSKKYSKRNIAESKRWKSANNNSSNSEKEKKSEKIKSMKSISKESSDTESEEDRLDIKDNTFENEISLYLRRKIIINGNNKELPNILYFIDKTKNDIMFDEIDSVFLVENRIKFDEKTVKLYYKHENKIYENCQNRNINFFEIEGKNIVFIENGISPNFCNKFASLLRKVYKFRNVFDNLFGTKEYGTKIIYYCDDEYKNNDNDFEYFQSTLQKAIDNCLKNGMKDVENYDFFTLYNYENKFIYHSKNIGNEINKIKIEQDGFGKELNRANGGIIGVLNGINKVQEGIKIVQDGIEKIGKSIEVVREGIEKNQKRIEKNEKRIEKNEKRIEKNEKGIKEVDIKVKELQKEIQFLFEKLGLKIE